jgi:hypothetical protein
MGKAHGSGGTCIRSVLCMLREDGVDSKKYLHSFSAIDVVWPLFSGLRHSCAVSVLGKGQVKTSTKFEEYLHSFPTVEY